MSYEAFERNKKRMPDEAAISILKQGNFGIIRRAEASASRPRSVSG